MVRAGFPCSNCERNARLRTHGGTCRSSARPVVAAMPDSGCSKPRRQGRCEGRGAAARWSQCHRQAAAHVDVSEKLPRHVGDEADHNPCDEDRLGMFVACSYVLSQNYFQPPPHLQPLTISNTHSFSPACRTTRRLAFEFGTTTRIWTSRSWV